MASAVALDRNVKRALLEVISSERDETEQRMRKRFRAEAASPKTQPLARNQRSALERHVASACGSSDEVRKAFENLKRMNFPVTISMIVGTLCTCMKVREWYDDAAKIEGMVLRTLKVYSERTIALKKLRRADRSSYLWEAVKLYASLSDQRMPPHADRGQA